MKCFSKTVGSSVGEIPWMSIEQHRAKIFSTKVFNFLFNHSSKTFVDSRRQFEGMVKLFETIVTVREDVYNSEGWMKLIHVRQNLLDEVPS
jgi:hypothetical protein